MTSFDVIPEILELLRRSGPMRTVAVKDEMLKVADRKGLVYRDAQVVHALAILKSRNLAVNASQGIWSITSEGAEHPNIAEDEARELMWQWRIRTGRMKGTQESRRDQKA